MTQQLVLAVTALLALPLLLLAIGVLAHAYLLARPRGGAGDGGVPPALVEAMVAESVDQLLAHLRVNAPPFEVPAILPEDPRAAVASIPLPTASRSSIATPLRTATVPSGANLVQAVAQLVGEGLSDRSIARRLRVGIDEVRVARAPQGGR